MYRFTELLDSLRAAPRRVLVLAALALLLVLTAAYLLLSGGEEVVSAPAPSGAPSPEAPSPDASVLPGISTPELRPSGKCASAVEALKALPLGEEPAPGFPEVFLAARAKVAEDCPDDQRLAVEQGLLADAAERNPALTPLLLLDPNQPAQR